MAGEGAPGGVDDFLYRKKISCLGDRDQATAIFSGRFRAGKEKSSTYEEQKYLSKEERRIKTADNGWKMKYQLWKKISQ